MNSIEKTNMTRLTCSESRFDCSHFNSIRKHCIFKQSNPSVQCPVKTFFLRSQGRNNCLLALAQLGKHVAKILCYDIDQFVKEGLMKTERATVAYRSTKDATQYITTPLIRGLDSISNREVEATDMVCDDTKGDVHLALF